MTPTRREFEAWIHARGWTAEREHHDPPRRDYDRLSVQDCWEAWLAAIAAYPAISAFDAALAARPAPTEGEARIVDLGNRCLKAEAALAALLAAIEADKAALRASDLSAIETLRKLRDHDADDLAAFRDASPAGEGKSERIDNQFQEEVP